MVEAGEDDLQDPGADRRVDVLGADDLGDDLEGRSSRPSASASRALSSSSSTWRRASAIFASGSRKGRPWPGRQRSTSSGSTSSRPPRNSPTGSGLWPWSKKSTVRPSRWSPEIISLRSGWCRTTCEGAWPGRLVDLPGAEVGLHLDPGKQVAVGLDDRVDAGLVVLAARLAVALQRRGGHAALARHLEPLLERRRRVVGEQAHVLPGRVHPELALGALDDRRRQPVVVGVGVGADEQASRPRGRSRPGRGRGRTGACAPCRRCPVSKRTMPPSAATAQTLPCGTPGQGSGRRSRQIPGRTFSVRGASGRLRCSAIAAAHSSQASELGVHDPTSVTALRSRCSDRLRAAMESSSPKRAGLVLAALILVAAVANLNLAVANVALPDIGKAFDSGQTTLNLVAVGYSLGLATSVLYLGALGDRYGRKMMLLLGMGLSIPASLLAGFAPSDRGPLRRPGARRRRRRHGLPHHAGADHGALVRRSPHPLDRALVGDRRRDRLARAAALRRPARAVRLGLGLPRHPAAGGPGALPGLALRARPRQRDHRAGRQPRRHPLDPAGRGAGAGDQPGPGAGQGHAGDRPRPRRPRGDRRLRDPPAPGALRRSTTSRWRGGGSSGSRPAPGSSSSAR